MNTRNTNYERWKDWASTQERLEGLVIETINTSCERWTIVLHNYVNIPETKTIKLVRTYQEKRRRQPIKKNYGHGRTGEDKKGSI